MSWFTRLRNAIHPQALDNGLAEELHDHLECRIAELQATGLTRAAAEQAAQRRFGNVTHLQEQTRDMRLSTWLEGTLQDASYAVRLMRKSPGFTATIVVSLGLAIGANTAVFSILDAALLRPLPVQAPDQLISIASPGIQESGADPEPESRTFSYPLFRQFREVVKGSGRLGLFSYISRIEVQLPGPEEPVEQVTQQHVSGDAFDILGIGPALGRLIGPEDDRTQPLRDRQEPR